MIYLYEEAIIEDLRYQLGDNRISIVPPDTVFTTIADIANDNVQLPLISLQRLGYSFNERSHSSPESLDGTSYAIPQKDGSIKHIQVQRIPITCRWQMDVINRTRRDNDNLMRELLFYYTNNPSLLVTIPYGLNEKHKFSISIDPDVDDNSDIESHASRGEYFRSTITIVCDDANLWKVTTRGPKNLKIQYYIEDKDKDTGDNLQLDLTNIPNDILGEGEITHE